jgi:hypothetical protein
MNVDSVDKNLSGFENPTGLERTSTLSPHLKVLMKILTGFENLLGLE